MTDFEIVEINNEVIRHKARQRELDNDYAEIQWESRQREEDNVILARQLMQEDQEHVLFPFQVFPIPHEDFEENEEDEMDPEDATVPLQNEEEKSIEEEEEDINNQMNLQAASSTPTGSNDNNTNNNSSNDSMFSAKSTNSATSFWVEFHPETKEGQNNQVILDQQRPLQLNTNDMDFLTEINNLNKTKAGNPRIVLSSARPSFGTTVNNDYFLCHICHLYPKIITSWKKDTNEYPFVRNFGAIIRHLLTNHCNRQQGARQLTARVEAFLSSIKEEIKTNPSIQKASSTSCLKAAWKSNQTKLTKEMVS